VEILTGRKRSAILSKIFVAVSVLGIIGAVYHAWSEDAFVTNFRFVSFSPYASLFGVPYWLFGLVWFPLVFLVSLWGTRFGREPLPKTLLILLTVGNLFTVYLWYLDFDIVRSFTAVYAALYATNYVLTVLVVADNRSRAEMRGFTYGTVTGGIVGLVFGPYGVAVFGVGGGIFGALQSFVLPPKAEAPAPSMDNVANAPYANR
jgi:uncharacterized membrane protein